MAFCLVKPLAEEFQKRLKEGKINPTELIAMGSEGRHSFFESFLGEANAKEVNALFETKLLLKNQQAGMINWAESVAGLKPETRRELVDKVNRLERVLNPVEEAAFLKDLAAKKLGAEVTVAEAKTVSDLARRTQESLDAIKEGGDPLEYGANKVALENYVNDLKVEAESMTPREYVSSGKNITKGAIELAGVAKSLKATLDNSSIFRQGWKTLFTNPGVWAKNAAQTFADIKNSLKGQDVLSVMKAGIYARENAINGNYKKMKLEVRSPEETYPSRLPEKIPLFGRLFKASEAAYTGFLYRTRADIADFYLKEAKANGVETSTPEFLQSTGKVINSLTGRGDLGKYENAGQLLNNVLFSPKFLKSQIDVLTMHAGTELHPFARKKAAKNLARVVIGTATLLAIAKALDPDSVETDPRSSDFGKIRIGDTRFDMTGGMASILTLASRFITNETKSSSSGIVKKLGEGYGSDDIMDVLYQFMENKASPVASLFMDLARREDRNGKPLTVAGELANFAAPLPITNAIETAKNPNSANLLAVLIADGLGISASTYSSTSDWETSGGKELTQFRQSVGDDTFKKANDAFNEMVRTRTETVRNDARYQSLSEEDKAKVLSRVKDQVKDEIFRQYNFRYKQEKANPAIQELTR